jgi:hypothetical protein
MNGWLLVRIAGIVVGIATLLRIATNEGIVTYDPLFLAWMDWLSDIVELGFLTKLIEPFLHWGIDYVRSFGISVPDLQDEWRPAFVFSMLMFGALARHSRSGLLVAAAPIGAIIVALSCGLVGHLVPVLAAVAAFNAFVTKSAVSTVAAVVFFALAVTVHSYGVNTIPATHIALSIAVVAFVFMMIESINPRYHGWRPVFASATFNTCIDILFTMSGALVIASLFANPSIW